ncbi:hypothetical protein [Slackia heliotrinireducens]|nr:hypothetical protein [Slackia heliotrinireducens]
MMVGSILPLIDSMRVSGVELDGSTNVILANVVQALFDLTFLRGLA